MKLENFNSVEKQVEQKTLETIESQIKAIKDNIYKWGTEESFLDEKDIVSKEMYQKKIKEAREELKALEDIYKTKILAKNQKEELKKAETVGDVKTNKSPIPMEERMPWIVKGVNKKIHDMPVEKLLTEIMEKETKGEKKYNEVNNKTVRQVAEEFENLKNERIMNPKEGLAVILVNLKTELKEIKKAFSSEFPKINIDDSKPIVFLPGHEEDKRLYDNMKAQYEILKRDIAELRTKITLIKDNREN